MVDIFQEVDEALKQEKIEKFWHEYKNTIITAIIVLIASTGATSFYKSWDANRNKTETAALMKALEAEDTGAAIEAFIQDTRTGHKVIAQLSQAALLLKDQKIEDAAAIYESIARQKSSPDNLRDLASVLAVRFGKDEGRIDYLKKLSNNPKAAFYWHANLESATFYAHEKQYYTKALAHLAVFKDNDAIPAGIKQQADALYAVYSQKAELNRPKSEAGAEKQAPQETQTN